MMQRLHPLGATRQRLAGFAPLPEDEVGIPPELLDEERAPDLDETLLWQAWELARLADPEARRAFFFLLAAVLVAGRRGSTRLSLEPSALSAALAEVGMPVEEHPTVAALLEKESALVGPDRPLVVEGPAVYTQRNLLLEARVARRLATRLQAGPVQAGEDAVLEAALASLRAYPPRAGEALLLLNEEQEEAVRRAARLPLAVISGGPGTGKTQIVVSILRVLARLGVSPEAVALAAPTGKAAYRMKESIRRALLSLDPPAEEDGPLLAYGLEPRTLHRLLGYLPSTGRFRHHEQNPLDAEVVIVDEASMIDLGLMDHLLRALAPRARLILLGDADQLPSVEAGAVFRDLVPGESAAPGDPRNGASVRLHQSYRMDPRDPAGRAIYLAAQAIQRGAPEAAGAIEARTYADELAFERVEGLPGGALGAFCERWYRERFTAWEEFHSLVRRTWGMEEGRLEDEAALARLFAHYEKSRILCLTKALETGTDAVNARIHRLHQEAVGGDPGAPFALGEPLMMQRNDYARGLFNGDQGLVLRVRAKGQARAGLQVVFPVGEGFRAFPLDLGSSLRPSWAMTVHKSQGSEFDAVALILPEAEIPLLTREALYTALTRARRSVVVVGETSIFSRGIARRLERETGIVERLQAEPERKAGATRGSGS